MICIIYGLEFNKFLFEITNINLSVLPSLVISNNYLPVLDEKFTHSFDQNKMLEHDWQMDKMLIIALTHSFGRNKKLRNFSYRRISMCRPCQAMTSCFREFNSFGIKILTTVQSPKWLFPTKLRNKSHMIVKKEN